MEYDGGLLMIGSLPSGVSKYRFVPECISLYEVEGEFYTTLQDAMERCQIKQFRSGKMPKISQIGQGFSNSPDIRDVFGATILKPCNYVPLSKVLGFDIDYINSCYALSDTVIERMLRDGRRRRMLFLFWKTPFFRERYPYIVKVDPSSGPQVMDAEFMSRLIEQPFKHWTSFTRGYNARLTAVTEMVFAFTREDDAFKFKMMLPW
jgi:hypothetical protein